MYMLFDRRTFMSPESCSNSEVLLSNRATSATIPTVSTKDIFFVVVFHFESMPFSDGQLSSPYPPSPRFGSTYRVALFSTGKNNKVRQQHYDKYI